MPADGGSGGASSHDARAIDETSADAAPSDAQTFDACDRSCRQAMILYAACTTNEVDPYSQCMAECFALTSYVPACAEPWRVTVTCTAGLGQGAVICLDGRFVPKPASCPDEWKAYELCITSM
jgi:hypothetical protein